MIRSRLKLLSICVVAFGAMAFSATAAQAETGAKWLYAEKAPNSGLVPFLEATVGLETENTGILHTEIAKTKVLFLCTVVSAENFVLKANGSIGSGARIKFSGCSIDINGVTSKPCEPISGGTEKGVIRSNKFHGLIVLHELASGVKDDLISIVPDTGETFSTLETSEECSLGEKIPVIGKVTFKDCENLALTHLVKHLVEVGPLTELWVISKTAEHVVSILGTEWAKLIGAHEGLKVSGDPA